MNEIQENKMGYMPINKLLLSMSLPMMVSMLVQALYNVVDSIFVSRISENAFTAVSLAFPIQNLMIAIASGLAVGVNALLSKSLGEKNFEQANRAANNGLFLACISYIIFLLFGIFGANLFFRTQTQDAEIVRHGTQYLSICCIASFGIFGQIAFERLLQSTGKTFYNMITQGIGAIINIILDPIFIFGLFGVPRLEAAGAAIATVIGQIVAMLLAVYFNFRKNHEIQISLRRYRPDWATIKRILVVGIPSIIMMSVSSVMTFLMNKILLMFSSTAAAVFGAYYKLQSFIFMPVFGLNNGMVPIVAYNYGARDEKRIMKTIWLSIIYAVAIMLIGLTLFQLIPEQLLSFFDASAEMTRMGVPALRLISLSFLFAGFCIIVSSAFQALGNGILSLIVSVARQLVVLVPVAYLLAQTGVLDYVWLSFPIAEIASLFFSVLFMVYICKTIIKPLGKAE